MKLLQFLFLAFIVGYCISCTPDDNCGDVDCGLGDCVQGICECPAGFFGQNCEIKGCFGVECVNGECDDQTQSCNCDPNYYGEKCNILCLNGEFVDGVCKCAEGYEGVACEIESRDNFLGWWACQEWSLSSQIADSTFTGPSLGSIKFECGNKVPEIEMFPTENSSGLMLLNSNTRILGLVKENKMNFELQYLTNEISVYGSGSFGVDQILSLELIFFNSTTSLTEVARGSFTIFRHLRDCS